MKIGLLKRLKRQGEVSAVESLPSIELQIAYLKRVPQEYTGERHIVAVGREANGKYYWQEWPGAPGIEGSVRSIIRFPNRRG